MPERKKTINILIATMAVAMVVVGVTILRPQTSPTAQTEPVSQGQEPHKTDFGASAPTDFPTDIPIEKGAQVQQSYSLNYAGQKQLTMVFLSSKTVKENYSLYAGFLKTQGWNVSNTYQNSALSSLYGTKGNTAINITISENTMSAPAKSQVSISVLKQ